MRNRPMLRSNQRKVVHCRAMTDSVLHAYERYDDRYQYLAKLVLDRFNYFIVSSAFLVGAFATTAGNAGLLIVSLVLSLIGIIMSISFTMINYVNVGYSAFVGKKRDDILKLDAGPSILDIYKKVQGELSEGDKIDERLGELPKKMWYLLGTIWVAINPCSKESFAKRLQDFNKDNYFAYTWLIPFFAAVVWMVPLFALAVRNRYVPAE